MTEEIKKSFYTETLQCSSCGESKKIKSISKDSIWYHCTPCDARFAWKA